MRAEFESKIHGLSRVMVGSKASRVAGLLLIAASSTGCITSNYDFEPLSGVGAHSRAARMSDDLALEQELGSDEALFDVSAIPLVHTSFEVFEESNEAGIPAGYVEADFDAYLPLCGIVDATLSRYDAERNLYERHDYNSYLWGLFQTHREQVDTKVGLRETKSRRLLWFFGWRSPSKYIDSASVLPPH